MGIKNLKLNHYNFLISWLRERSIFKGYPLYMLSFDLLYLLKFCIICSTPAEVIRSNSYHF